MFNVYSVSNNQKVIVYAVREENEVLQFLTYFGEWEWYDASNYYAVQELEE